MQSLILSALFWKFSLTYQKKQYFWSFSLLYIKYMQHSRYTRKLFASTRAKTALEWIKRVISLWR
jgi:hypothetical protein